MAAQAQSTSKAAALGRAIQLARLGAGYRQQDVARIVRRQQQYVSLLESGHIAEPPAELLALLARVYSVNVVVWFDVIGYTELASAVRGQPAPGATEPKRIPKARGTPRVRRPHVDGITR